MGSAVVMEDPEMQSRTANPGLSVDTPTFCLFCQKKKVATALWHLVCGCVVRCRPMGLMRVVGRQGPSIAEPARKNALAVSAHFIHIGLHCLPRDFFLSFLDCVCVFSFTSRTTFAFAPSATTASIRSRGHQNALTPTHIHTSTHPHTVNGSTKHCPGPPQQPRIITRLQHFVIILDKRNVVQPNNSRW